MKIGFFDTHEFERVVFQELNEKIGFDIEFLDSRLTAKTAPLANGCQAVCCFVNDKIDAECLQILKRQGVQLIALRSAGFNHVDVVAAQKENISVCRVPGYSPHAVAEYTIGLILSLNRKIHRAHLRIREQNFSLEGLVGFDLNGKTVGIIGTGKIGKIVAEMMTAFGCEVLAYDIQKDPKLAANPSVKYVELSELCSNSDVISLHIPLNPQTFHILNQSRIASMKNKAIIVNTGRGALIDTQALIKALKTEQIGGAALDVYEEEEGVFFQDLSNRVLKDDVLVRLLTFPNVLLTSHQAFLTKEALNNIAQTTLESLLEFDQQGKISSEKLVQG